MESNGKIKIMGFEHGKGWEEKIWQNFLENIESSGYKHKTAEFLDDILSPNEKKIIAKRLAALSLIESGKSYKEIGKILWISPSTISALRKTILEAKKYRSSRYYSAMSRSDKGKKIPGLPPSTILDYWASLSLPSKTRKGRRKF